MTDTEFAIRNNFQILPSSCRPCTWPPAHLQHCASSSPQIPFLPTAHYNWSVLVDVQDIFFLVLCFYLLWKPCNIFINCQFCVDKDAWSLKQQKNIISSKSLNIYLNISCNRFIFGVFVNTWTVVRKVVPNRGSLSALLFPWIWVRITWSSSGFRAIYEIWNHVTHYRPAFNSLFIQNSPQYKSTCRKNSFSIPWSTSYHPSLTQNVSTPGHSLAR